MQLKFKHFIALNTLDVLTTWYGLTYLGLTEGNAFANGLFQEYGLVISLIALKLIGLVVIWMMLKHHTTMLNKFGLNIKNKIEQPMINIGCILFMIVVANNIYQIIDFYR